MIPRELLATARAPGGEELRLYRHDGAFSIRVGGVELMTSRVHGSEEELAELAIARRGAGPLRRILVGGLGMGFTLSRVLSLVPPEAAVETAELVPEIVAWNRAWFGDLAGRPLDDPRVVLREGDVGACLAGRAAYDVILLDVDNGPAGLVRKDNDSLYSRRGLQRIRQALARGGVLGVWSSGPDSRFGHRLEQASFAVEERRVRARRTKGPVRTIWLATRR